MQFDHIGIVVATLATGREYMGATLGITRWTGEFTDPANGVYVQFGHDSSGICYELVAPYGSDSPIAKALASGRMILNHVAYRVADLDGSAEKLSEAGSVATGPAQPAIAYKGKRIQFFLTRLRFIIELIEAPDHQHLYTEPAV